MAEPTAGEIMDRDPATKLAGVVTRVDALGALTRAGE
jgi:hypothetical protein